MRVSKGRGLFIKFVEPYLKKLRKGGPQTLRGVYKGKVHDLPGLHLDPRFAYKKRPTAVRKALRKEFDGGVRKNYLKSLDLQDLRRAGFSEADIALIRNGKVPKGYSVHHKYPLDDSGTNAHSNLVLLRNGPDHHLVTNHQRFSTWGQRAGETREIPWPTYPPGTTIWPPVRNGSFDPVVVANP